MIFTMINALQGAIDVDTNVFLFFNGAHNEFFDYFMKAYSGKWIWVPLYATFLYVMIRNFTIKQTILCVIGLSLTIAFADQICATFIRPFVERLRPANLDNPISPLVHIVGNYRGGSYGFPSCHAANTFGLAFFIFFLFKRYWLTLFIMCWAVLTCYSRIYLGVHYPGDLLAGMVVGFVGASIMYFLFTRLSNYRRAERIHHVYSPILIGMITIVCISAYSAHACLFT